MLLAKTPETRPLGPGFRRSFIFTEVLPETENIHFLVKNIENFSAEEINKSKIVKNALK